jgi:hypothetical protein
MNLDQLRPSDEAELQEICAFMEVQLGKREMLLSSLAFVANNNSIAKVRNNMSMLITAPAFANKESLFRELIRFAPSRITDK